MAAIYESQLRNFGWLHYHFLIHVIFLFSLASTFHDDILPMDEHNFRFTQSIYNTTIYENSVGKTYLMSDVKMGIHVTDPTLDIRYKITNGDKDKFFKPEKRLIGDFCFLFIRTRTGNNEVLNREQRDEYHLTVKATVRPRTRSGPLLEAHTDVIVRILDTNDLNPLFFPTQYSITIGEDTPLHKNVLKVTASDADVGINGEIYYSFLENTEMFAIHPTTGAVTLTRPLNFENRSYFEISVLAEDRGPKFRDVSRASSARLRINIKQVNLHNPEIHILQSPYVIENSNTRIVAILRVTDHDENIHGEIKSVDIVSGDPDHYFRIRPGYQKDHFNIETLHTLDREVTPYGYNLTIRASDKGIPPKSSMLVVPIKLMDMNDQAPKFEKSQYDIMVEEIVPVKTPLLIVKATDIDWGKNAELSYAITSGNEDGTFDIIPTTGLIVTKKVLDAEKIGAYTLEVEAIDHGNLGMRKRGQTHVSIKILDANDNSPIFNNSVIEVTLDEGLPKGSVVYKVSARDIDQGENGYVSYSIANINPVPFSIDHFSGEIKLKEVLDYESMQRLYTLKVRASDWGVPYRRESEMTINVKLLDINDHKPVFEKIDCTGHLSRKAPASTNLMTLSAIDFDSGNIISYQLLSGNENGCFHLDSNLGILTVTCDVRDFDSEYRTLRVTASDGILSADPMFINITLVDTNRNQLLTNSDAMFYCKETGVAQQLTELLRLSEKNNQDETSEMEEFPADLYRINRHSPSFQPGIPEEIEIDESISVGSKILDMKAKDNDHGYNGKLVYVISDGNDFSCFKIDTFTGELTVMSEVDREQKDKFVLNITVSDLGQSPKSVFKMLTIKVLDANDNPPVFQKNSFNIALSENFTPGSSVVHLQATDDDFGPNAEITYGLMTDTSDFLIDSKSGLLTVNKFLDRERQEHYDLHINAVDGSKIKPLSSVAIVTITIIDENDNVPKFNMESHNVKIREDLPIGSVVMIMSANDPDSGNGGILRYSMIDGGDDKFEIDKLTGIIRIAQKLDFEKKQMYNISIRCRDKGEPSLSAVTQIMIEIVDVNENMYPPRFEDFVLSGSVEENQPIGTMVMTVSAKDIDGPENKIIYSIRDGNGIGRFTISEDGVIKTSDVLDRETTRRYWLTVYAQDRAPVPLHSKVEVYIEVLDVNDNIPQTQEPIYFPSVPEDSPPGTSVVKIEAYDLDANSEQKLTYKITSGNPQGFFVIDSNTGLITTTSRKLDRESQEEHELEVTVMDNGKPSLSSTTRVIVTVSDINDHAPRFLDRFYRIRIPEQGRPSGDVPLFRIVAFDPDSGSNADIDYSIKPGKGGHTRFKIHPKTGMVFSGKEFEKGQDFEFTVKAVDNGRPQKKNQVNVMVTVVSRPQSSPNPPIVRPINSSIAVVETDPVEHMVCLIEAEDPDKDYLWYSIVGGNVGDEFFIDTEKGVIMLAKQLDWETRGFYNLSVSVTDGVHTVYTQVLVKVVDINDNRPEFSDKIYLIDISENISSNKDIVRVTAVERDEDKRVFYSLQSSTNPSSMNKFKIGITSGMLSTSEKLDRESIAQHVLTVMVKDNGTPPKRNYARIIINVQDHNDHQPEFLSDMFDGSVFETVAIGTSVAQVLAIDRDKGKNAEIRFSIVSGNVGNTFDIDPVLGSVIVAKELDRQTMDEYLLVVKATDGGDPPLSLTVYVRIVVTISDNAPPKFAFQEYSTEISENRFSGTYVVAVSATSRSSVIYEIMDGNKDGLFDINPNSGVITTKSILDYEETPYFNLTVQATNMVNTCANTTVLVHVLDLNDNAPKFKYNEYFGKVSEAAPIGSVVLDNDSIPLVIAATDNDSDLNALLKYEIVENAARRFFSIDSTTGAIHTTMNLDHEEMKIFEFSVQVSDSGRPRLSAEVSARVKISIMDINDSPPQFEYDLYNATLLLPTYKDVAVVSIRAIDPDTEVTSELTYDITSGSYGKFKINDHTGMITVLDAEGLGKEYNLVVRASDGKFSSMTHVYVTVDVLENNGLRFSQAAYFARIVENSTEVKTVAVVSALGNNLNEHLIFAILNPNEMFTIGRTSGVIKTTGIPFDREVQQSYTMVIEAQDERPELRIAHVQVQIEIVDVNDNPPVFINLPYYAVVSLDAKVNEVVREIKASDKDIDKNGEISYELKSGDDGTFRINRSSGEITLIRTLDDLDQNKEYRLTIEASDGGKPPLKAEVIVPIRIMNRAMPIFEKQYYTGNVFENVLPYTMVLSIQANGPEDRKLMYSISKGDPYDAFSLDFTTAPGHNGPCVVQVIDELDYETQNNYQLVIRATDTLTSVYAEVLVNINVLDVNDNPPTFSQGIYEVSVPEVITPGIPLLTVSTTDRDTGVNKLVHYQLEVDQSNASQLFHIDSARGMIFTKQSLDHERQKEHIFTIIATDSGTPARASTAKVMVKVTDLNDNPPRFDQPSYNCILSEDAPRNHFVIKVMASDPDESDVGKLMYSIIGGNEQQIFSIDSKAGIISSNLKRSNLMTNYMLNVSISDGVYTNFARVTVDVISSNRHNPKFKQDYYEVEFEENTSPRNLVAMVSAVDNDRGKYGAISYNIDSEHLRELFEIHPHTGEVFNKKMFDREVAAVYSLPITASDGGGKTGFTQVRVNVIDKNDNDPKFRVNEYKANIHANMSVGTTIVKITAFDLDDGINADINYSIYDTDELASKIFYINQKSGELVLKKSVLDQENQIYQFFIHATDLGNPPLQNQVAIGIYIMGPKDVPPVFEQKSYQFFIPENAPVGSTIATLTAASNESVVYTIMPLFGIDDEDSSKFQINNQGVIEVRKPLDREEKDMYMLTIKVSTQSTPPLTGFTELTVKLMDMNDNTPIFEARPYRVSIAENADIGTRLVQVLALDKDLGNNADIKYSFGSNVGELINIFSLDAKTGWIKTLVSLDREKTASYSFEIVATDNGIPEPLSSSTSVEISVMDYNDNAPIFAEKRYTTSVNEAALPGTVIVRVNVTDEDQYSTIQYHILKGDPLGQFNIRQTGEVFVVKELDRETTAHYQLTVIVNDGTFTSLTQISVDVLDANDNAPICKQAKYSELLSESISKGSFLFQVQALDMDEGLNARLTYVLSGDGVENFSLDRSSGVLTTIQDLDRETQNIYDLKATVSDKNGQKCTSEIQIILSDINDNPPVFSKLVYTVAVPEDTDPKTLITRIHATDQDLGINRKVRYSFVDSARGHFMIDENSGIISLAKPLDREERASYNLTVRATDQGTPMMSSIANVIVLVLDVNDNPPEFAHRIYYSSIPENKAVNSEVVIVLATSKDTGINAEITYSIISGNEQGKFAIHPKTGVITIEKPLDYETCKDFYLTIQANDGGNPSLSSQSRVNINVTDANDNAPMFGLSKYETKVREDAFLDERVIKVSATDMDSPPNAQVTYSIVKGDEHNQFKIDNKSGEITVAGPLDRETIAKYVLEVAATDSGILSLTSVALVNIDIDDANDNAPRFSKANHSAIVMLDKLKEEDRSVGYSILKLIVSDPDSSVNGAPFTFDIVSGNEENDFSISNDGTLRATTKFNQKVKDEFILQVRVFDNGSPPLSSDTWVFIKIIEESRFAPVLTNVEAVVISYQDEFQSGVICRLSATDQDIYDQLTYKIVSDNGDYFEIDSADGTISVLHGLDVGEYILNVSVSDGKFTSYGEVKIFVKFLSEEMLENSVSIRFDDVTPERFIQIHQRHFLKLIRSFFGVRNVEIISIQPAIDIRSRRDINNDLDVLFAVQKSLATYIKPSQIQYVLSNRIKDLQTEIGLKIVEIVSEECSKEFCSHGICKDKINLDLNVITITTESSSFVSPRYERVKQCICREGYGGNKCDIVINKCADNHCHSYQVCIPDYLTPKGYTCVCPEGKMGPTCSDDMDTTCVDHECNKEKRPMTFTGKSYAFYSLANPIDRSLHLSLRIRTAQATGNIMYAAGRVDYSILELVNGFVQYRIDCGSGEGMVRVDDININDGIWHEIVLNRRGNRAEITVDGRYKKQGNAPGINDVLNMDNNDVFFGAEVKQYTISNNGEDIQMGLLGCLDDIRINQLALPHTGSNRVAAIRRFTNIDFHCHATSDPGICGSQPCFNGGTCKAEGDKFSCQCHHRFYGSRCEIDTNPCASNPCMHGGVCRKLNNDYMCDCHDHLSGKRCDYGYYCSPNPCLNNGLCEEGTYSAICKCQGFEGDVCEKDIDECINNPCKNGGICQNTWGSFRCNCTGDTTGLLCNEILGTTRITSNRLGITLEEIIGIIAVVVAILLIVVVFIFFRKWWVKRTRLNRSHGIARNTSNDVILNKTRPEDDDLKRCSKLSNLDVGMPPPVPTRPASYTPSGHDSYSALNNFDTVRSYGSAADDLETIPRYTVDYLQNFKNNTASVAPNLPPPPPSNSASDSESIQKSPWEIDNIESLYKEGKIQNENQSISCDQLCIFKLASNCVSYSSPAKYLKQRERLNNMTTFGRGIEDSQNHRLTEIGVQQMSSISSLPSVSEDDLPVTPQQGRKKGYHWDCSDWAPSQNLPNITEVPISEIRDSPSLHSNESNTHVDQEAEDTIHEEDPELHENDSEYVGDSEYAENEFDDSNEPFVRPSSFEHMLSMKDIEYADEDDYNSPCLNYQTHPNQYLPKYNYVNDHNADNDNWPGPAPHHREENGNWNDNDRAAAAIDVVEDVPAYGFPHRGVRSFQPDDYERGSEYNADYSTISALDEMSISVGGYTSTNVSCSDISGLCDIDDSEVNGSDCDSGDDSRLSKMSNAHLHTQV